MKLSENAPELHNDAMQTVLSGQLRMSRQAFNDYWIGQSMDPAAMAAKLGVTLSVHAVTGREYAEVPTANFQAVEEEHVRRLKPKSPGEAQSPG